MEGADRWLTLWGSPASHHSCHSGLRGAQLQACTRNRSSYGSIGPTSELQTGQVGSSRVAAVCTLCSGLSWGSVGSPTFLHSHCASQREGGPLESTSVHTLVSAPAFMTPAPECAPLPCLVRPSLRGNKLRGEGTGGPQAAASRPRALYSSCARPRARCQGHTGHRDKMVSPPFVGPTSQQETPDLGVGRQGCPLSTEMVILTTARALGTQSPWQILGTGQDCPPQGPLSPPHAEPPAPVLGLLAQAPGQ